MNKSNIYLIGMMGSGKTVTGRRLATMLGMDFVDLDQMIEQKTGRSISELFEKESEAYFRDQESVLLKEVSSIGSRVVATGGGAVLQPENVECMRRTGKIVFLKTSLEDLWPRVKDKKDRPLLGKGNPREALAKIYASRAPLYEKAYDFEVNTDGQKAEAVARKILDWIQKK